MSSTQCCKMAVSCIFHRFRRCKRAQRICLFSLLAVFFLVIWFSKYLKKPRLEWITFKLCSYFKRQEHYAMAFAKIQFSITCSLKRLSASLHCSNKFPFTVCFNLISPITFITQCGFIRPFPPKQLIGTFDVSAPTKISNILWQRYATA